MPCTRHCNLVYMNCFSCQCRCNTVLATWVTQSTLLEAIHQRDTGGCNTMFLFLSCMSVISSAMCLSVNSTMPDDAYTCSRANLSLLQVFACRKAINLYSDYWYSPNGDFTEFAPQDIIHRFMHLTRVFVHIHYQLPWRITGAFTAVFLLFVYLRSRSETFSLDGCCRRLICITTACVDEDTWMVIIVNVDTSLCNAVLSRG